MSHLGYTGNNQFYVQWQHQYNATAEYTVIYMSEVVTWFHRKGPNVCARPFLAMRTLELLSDLQPELRRGHIKEIQNTRCGRTTPQTNTQYIREVRHVRVHTDGGKAESSEHTFLFLTSSAPSVTDKQKLLWMLAAWTTRFISPPTYDTARSVVCDQNHNV